ncbi:MAG: hypothetical protein ACRC0L_06055 [Angustibacter sp.]
MAGWFAKGKQRLAQSSNWETSTYMAVAINATGTGTTYTYSRTHADLTSVPAGSRQGTPVALTGKTVNAAGEITCDPFTMTGLAQGQETIEAVLIYEETAAADASRFPLLYLDGINLTPNGSSVVFTPQATSPFLGRF